MTLQAILFDKDGTLIDFDETWGPAAYEVMRVLSADDERCFEALARVSEYVVSERRFLPTSPLVAGSSANYGPLWAEALGRPAGLELYSEMDRLFLKAGLRHLAPIQEPAAIVAVLRKRGLRLGIATNDAEDSARLQAAAMGLDPHLDFIAGYDSGFGSKPEPGMVLAFAAACGVSVNQVALVGDSLHDLHAARAAGAMAVAVLTGPLREAARPDLEPHADYILHSIAEVPALVDRLRANASPSRSPIS